MMMMAATASKHAILIVDDHIDTADMLRRFLDRRGIQAQCVATGEGALARIRSEPPCCVILDEMMPGMTGSEVVAHIRADPAIAHTTIIMFTAGFDVSKRTTAMTQGVVAWLYKGSEQAVDEMAHW